MAHYALIDPSTYEVLNVITGRDEDDLDTLPDGYESWEDFYGTLHGLVCKRTSRHTRGNQHYTEEGTLSDTPEKAIRYNYASVGGTYDPDRDAFIDEQPVPNWVLDEETLVWVAPVPIPDGFDHPIWNVETGEWENIPPSPEAFAE